jgi:hypothetical protein
MIVFAVRHEQAHRWVPLDALDTPPTASKDAFLGALRKGPDAHNTRVVAGRGEERVVWVRYAGPQCRTSAEVPPARKRPASGYAASAPASLPPVAPGGANLESWPPQPPDQRRWRPRGRGRRACALGDPQSIQAQEWHVGAPPASWEARVAVQVLARTIICPDSAAALRLLL